MFILGIRVFPPFQFNFAQSDKAAKNTTKVFRIYTGNASQPLNFFIVNITATDIVTPTDISWKNLSLQKSNVDCSALKFYPEPRSHFCIDHMSGIVYSTVYYKFKNLTENTKYKIRIRVQNEVTNTFIDQIYTVDIIAKCSLATKQYKTLLNGTACQSGIGGINATLSNSTVVFTAIKRTYILGFGVTSFNRGTTQFSLDIKAHDKSEYNSKHQDISRTNISANLFVNVGETITIDTIEIMGIHRDITKRIVVIYYMSNLNLCKATNCGVLYKNWTQTLLSNTSECSYDSQLVGSYFKRCRSKYPFM